MIINMEHYISANDYVKAVEFASRKIGMHPEALIRILNEDLIGSLIENSMRVEDSTIEYADGQLLPSLAFQKAITLLGATLDTVMDIGLNPPLAFHLHGENDNKIPEKAIPTLQA